MSTRLLPGPDEAWIVLQRGNGPAVADCSRHVVQRVGPGEKGSLCRPAEAQRSSRRSAPFLLQDANSSSLLRHLQFQTLKPRPPATAPPLRSTAKSQQAPPAKTGLLTVVPSPNQRKQRYKHLYMDVYIFLYKLWPCAKCGTQEPKLTGNNRRESPSKTNNRSFSPFHWTTPAAKQPGFGFLSRLTPLCRSRLNMSDKLWMTLYIYNNLLACGGNVPNRLNFKGDDFSLISAKKKWGFYQTASKKKQDIFHCSTF